MKRYLYSSFLLFFFMLTVHVLAYEQQSINITVNGKSRNMVVFTPNELPAKSPLFIVTHGMNQDPEYQYGSDKLYELIDTAKFVIAYLRSDGNTWDVGGTKDQNFVTQTITEMANLFDIDKDRVYWSGFSMGSMLIHHCIANMQDKIAAFAPTSGIQFSEQPWNNCKKPVNLLECIAYDDDVFGYEQYGIHAYIENYAKHDKHTQYSKAVGYKPVGSSWQDGDMEKWTGGPNGGEVWLYSFNNGGHWPSDQNRSLIWNFCKRFSLKQPKARIAQPEGETTHLYMGPEEEAVFPEVTFEATAKATNGQIAKVDLYDGQSLLESLTEAPYTTTLTAPVAGKHNLRVEVTDDNNRTADASCLVDCVVSQDTYNLDTHFNTEGVVPQDWYVSNGSKTIVGGGLPNNSGPRLLHFTNDHRAFNYGLLVQNATNNEKAAWAKFGDKTGRSTMALHAGHYILKYRIYNWNCPEFSPVTIAIERSNGEIVASKEYTPTVNIGGNTANEFSGIRQQKFEFDIAKTGHYVLVFYTDSKKNADFVLGPVSIQVKEFCESGIKETTAVSGQCSTIYDLSGRRMKEGKLTPGLYIIDGRKTVIQ